MTRKLQKRRNRKIEFLGVPLDANTKRRLQRMAESMRTKPTPLARDYILAGIERDEREAAA